MKIRPSNKWAREKGWALIAVMSLAATGLLMVASVISWANENATVVGRNNEYFATTYAAEAATEKALGAMVQDDQDYGAGIVQTETSYYTGLIPTASDNSYWTNFLFSGGTTTNKLIVQEATNATATNVLGRPTPVCISVGATYDIIANAQNAHSTFGTCQHGRPASHFRPNPNFSIRHFLPGRYGNRQRRHHEYHRPGAWQHQHLS